jgi:hypothetical protein
MNDVDLSFIKMALTYLREREGGDDLFCGSFGDWAFSKEVDYQIYWLLDEDDWDFSPKDPIARDFINNDHE